jgi:hypothetical protein
VINLAIVAPAIVSRALPAPVTCSTPGQTLATEAGTRLYQVGDGLYGCWADTGRARLLDQIDVAAPTTPALPQVAGRFAAYRLGDVLKLADLHGSLRTH